MSHWPLIVWVLLIAWWLVLCAFGWAICRAGALADQTIDEWERDR